MQNNLTTRKKHTNSFLRIFSCILLAILAVLFLSACSMFVMIRKPQSEGKISVVRLTKSGLIAGKKATYTFDLTTALTDTETLKIKNIGKYKGTSLFFDVSYPAPDAGVDYEYTREAANQVAKIAKLINNTPDSYYTATASQQKLTLTAKEAGVKGTAPSLECYSAQNYTVDPKILGAEGVKGIYQIDIADYPLESGYEYTDDHLGVEYAYDANASTAAQQAAAIVSLINNIDANYSIYEAEVVDSTGIKFTALAEGPQVVYYPQINYTVDSTPCPRKGRAVLESEKMRDSPVFTNGVADTRIPDEYEFTFNGALEGEKLLLTNMVVQSENPTGILEYIPSSTETTAAQQALAFVTLVNSKPSCLFTATVPANGTKVTLTLKSGYTGTIALPVRTVEKL